MCIYSYERSLTFTPVKPWRWEKKPTFKKSRCYGMGKDVSNTLWDISSTVGFASSGRYVSLGWRSVHKQKYGRFSDKQILVLTIAAKIC